MHTKLTLVLSHSSSLFYRYHLCYYRTSLRTISLVVVPAYALPQDQGEHLTYLSKELSIPGKQIRFGKNNGVTQSLTTRM